MKLKTIAGLGALLLLAACATAKTWTATGGSRADGTVALSYEYGLFESPVTDDAAGLTLARQRCAVWGYSGAEAFGGVTTQCNAMGSSGCIRTLVTKQFQCTGQGNGGYAEILVRSPASRPTRG